ncbi:MAG: non-heme iron oxygenase ferredoxin subunit [Pirellula sp.]
MNKSYMVSKTKDFHFACKLSDLKPNQPNTFEIDDRFVVLVIVDGQVYCVEDLCTHDGGTLGDGELHGLCLICPRHGAKFDVRNGHAMCMPATEPTLSHEVKIQNDEVHVRIRDDITP